VFILQLNSWLSLLATYEQLTTLLDLRMLHNKNQIIVLANNLVTVVA